MKDKIVGWVLIVKHGYKEFWFTFDECNLAAIFLKTWHNHLLKTDDYDKDENIEYTIRPLFGEESELNEVEDDIPVN